jgi:hypothetical protein
VLPSQWTAGAATDPAPVVLGTATLPDLPMEPVERYAHLAPEHLHAAVERLVATQPESSRKVEERAGTSVS